MIKMVAEAEKGVHLMELQIGLMGCEWGRQLQHPSWFFSTPPSTIFLHPPTLRTVFFFQVPKCYRTLLRSWITHFPHAAMGKHVPITGETGRKVCLTQQPHHNHLSSFEPWC